MAGGIARASATAYVPRNPIAVPSMLKHHVGRDDAPSCEASPHWRLFLNLDQCLRRTGRPRRAPFAGVGAGAVAGAMLNATSTVAPLLVPVASGTKRYGLPVHIGP